MFETRYNQQDFDGLVALFSRDAVYTDPYGRYEGRDAIRAWFAGVALVFSDGRIEASLVIEHGNTVVAEWRYRSTHTGPLPMPDGTLIPATGNTMEQAGVTILEIDNGKIVSARDYFDAVPGMRQVGLLPSS